MGRGTRETPRTDPIELEISRDHASPLPPLVTILEGHPMPRVDAARARQRLRPRNRTLRINPYQTSRLERNVREGFLERATFDAVVRALSDDLQDFARFAYLTGWRRGEVQTLGWADVDRTHGRIRLRREHSKNGEPRVLVLVGELSAVIERRWAAREYRRSNGETAISPLVFHRKGRPVGDIRKAWGNACTAAGVGGTLFHDLRRSAVRNFEKAGVSQVVAMKISGHKTASIYCRYRIVDEADIADALTRTEVAFRDAPRAVVSSLRSASERQG